MSFFPLDREILTSSLWSDATPTQLKIMLFLLLKARPADGVVTDTVPSIAQQCGVTVEDVENALTWLEQPDPYSRTPDREGRRIEQTTEGIRLLTYEKHRDRDHSTARVRRFRERQKAANAETKRNAVSALHETAERCSTVAETTDKDKDKDKEKEDRSSNNPNSNSRSRSSRAKHSGTTTLPLASRETADRAEDVARRYVAARDAVYSGRTRQLAPDVVEKTRQRLRDWKPWQIVAVPILVYAQGRREKCSPEVFLRDGKSPRSRDGNTFGAYYWLARTYEKADGTRLDERLTAIADQAGVSDELRAIGVLMEGDSP